MQPLIDADVLKNFVPVEGQKGYWITRWGWLWSEYSNDYLRGYVGENGYRYYTFKDGTREYAHRLVAKHFIPNPDNKPEVNHKDFNRLYNWDFNLEWTTTGENLEHAHTKNDRKKVSSYRHSNTKLSDEDIITIYNSDLSERKLAAMYGTSSRTVHNIKHGIRHSRVTKGELHHAH